MSMYFLTFDIEEWSLARNGGYGTPEKYAEYDAFLDKILDLLDATSTKATFFCTGQMAEFFPSVVRKIQSRGHEIGCHSYCHTWMNKMDFKAAELDTKMAVDALEQCLGEKVHCYRAPAFSIGESNKWMFEILASCGITCDASVFPASRDFGGFPGFQSQEPCIVVYNGIQIKEFPICLTRVFGKEVAFSGGGYFRFFPFSFVKSRILKQNYSMCYFHIDDLLPQNNRLKTREEYEAYFRESGTISRRIIRHMKSNVGKSQAWKKLKRLVEELSFTGVIQSLSSIDTQTLPIVSINE